MELHVRRPTLPLEPSSFGRSKPCLLILNQPILDLDLLDKLWQNSAFRLCADGGANRLYDALSGELVEKYRDDYLPSRIHGDLDSLRPGVRHFYEQNGVPVTLDPDVYSTDFGKALKVIRQTQDSATIGSEEHYWGRINILGSISGRVDQGLGLLHEMFREQTNNPQLELYLFSESSISYILRPGRYNTELDVSKGIVTANVGILPIYGPATISTQGLEWDVKEWKTQMGGNVSTSNHIIRNEVEIETDANILFTVERAEPSPPDKT